MHRIVVDVQSGEITEVELPQEEVDTAGTGGTETRPRNVALLYCVKY